jgi:hypothetical protein
MGIPLYPAKTDMPLVIDADAMLPLAIACKFLQPIPWWNTQIF